MVRKLKKEKELKAGEGGLESGEATGSLLAGVDLKKEVDDEPSWYHYVIVLAVLLFLVLGVYFVTWFFVDDSPVDGGFNGSNVSNGSVVVGPPKTYDYPYVVGNITYNIKFNSPVDVLNGSDMRNELLKRELWGTHSFVFSYLNYSGDGNGRVTVASIKLKRFLDSVYSFSFTNESFRYFDEVNCSSSSFTNRVVVFDIESNVTGVFDDDKSGCVWFRARNSSEIMFVVDKFIWEMIEG